ncbi:MAG: hypothetical protein H6865_03025 [Rhodospirillales bacterium]|nr:hypothetical protein [Alphaproteobacteria bacterium]MCB9986590.1 hypothetical protein [Rhodospirillales bacterium]USO06880.1 MAG: hypothetical protein H6866_05360 [Rhodospirillales bacterium]
MRGGLRAYLRLIGVFGACLGALVFTGPARAQFCDACVVAAINTTSAAQIANIRQVILGIATVGTPMQLGKAGDIAPIPVMSPVAPIPYTSLVGYFEQVFFPRLIELSKMQTGNQQKFTAVQGQQNVRTADATAQVNYKQDVSKMQVKNAAEAVGLPDTMCIQPSMGQSNLAAEIMAIQGRDSLEKQAALETAGSTQTPNYSRGPAYLALKQIDQRKSQTCVKTGDAGASQAVCTGGNSDLENADVVTASLLSNWTLSLDASKLQSLTFAKQYIANLFPDRAFDPIPTDAQNKNPLPAAVARAMNDKVAYNATMNTLMQPFQDEVSDRTPLSVNPSTGASTGGVIAAKNSLLGAVNRAGYEGAAKEKLLSLGDNMSRAALEYIQYKVYENDPQTIISDVGSGSVNILRTTAFLVGQAMKQVSLLYDIREQIKTSNRLLGVIGSLLARNEFDAIQDNIHAIKNAPGN